MEVHQRIGNFHIGTQKTLKNNNEKNTFKIQTSAIKIEIFDNLYPSKY